MLFHSQVFVLGFLPAVLLLFYAVARRRRAREAVLVAASVTFYGWWDPRYVPLLVGLALATWGVARAYLAWTERDRRARWPTLFLLLGIALNLGALGVFKYADFIGSSVAALLAAPYRPLDLVLPLGISFFVFQKLSYLIDLYRGDRHRYGLLDFALFVSFFPQLIAGPLVRHNEIIGQFASDPRGPRMWENLSRGAVLFAIGMAKKLAIADTLARNSDRLFDAAMHTAPNAAEAWAAAASYALQIYFDFSGYSDMAIGLALMFGLTLPMNFNAPYRAVSIRDFWRRWHITLSRFLRDYLYIPLGGNRAGEGRRIVNVVVTMLLGGLWHGAAWKFVAWGGLHGVALAVNGAWDRARLPRLPKPVGWGATLLFVTVAWVPFRAADFATALRMVEGMAGRHGFGHVVLRDGWLLPVAAALAMIGPTSTDVALGALRPRAWVAIPAGAAMAFLVLLAGGRLHDAFIYFQF
ncbi:MAG: MBOAT family protein [Acidisphaera sp.]|nr:MBOAT family protein [Acidisphaera sp.]